MLCVQTGFFVLIGISLYRQMLSPRLGSVKLIQIAITTLRFQTHIAMSCGF
jgi:hypothetical protein